MKRLIPLLIVLLLLPTAKAFSIVLDCSSTNISVGERLYFNLSLGGKPPYLSITVYANGLSPTFNYDVNYATYSYSWYQSNFVSDYITFSFPGSYDIYAVAQDSTGNSATSNHVKINVYSPTTVSGPVVLDSNLPKFYVMCRTPNGVKAVQVINVSGSQPDFTIQINQGTPPFKVTLWYSSVNPDYFCSYISGSLMIPFYSKVFNISENLTTCYPMYSGAYYMLIADVVDSSGNSASSNMLYFYADSPLLSKIEYEIFLNGMKSPINVSKDSTINIKFSNIRGGCPPYAVDLFSGWYSYGSDYFLGNSYSVPPMVASADLFNCTAEEMAVGCSRGFGSDVHDIWGDYSDTIYVDFNIIQPAPVQPPVCRVCDPLSISDYGLRGLCLYLNFVMCNPFFIVMVIIFVLVIFILGKLLGR